MSADNGVYICQFPDGFRVSDCSAIENIYYYPPNTPERKQILKDYFGQSPLFKTEEEAYKFAVNGAKDDYYEYGIGTLNGMHENWE